MMAAKPYHHKLLYYALTAMTVMCAVYLLSAFGLVKIYAHFFGKTHPHKWHTLFRFCFVIGFALVNHWVLVPRLYIEKRYFAFFYIVIICLVGLFILPDILLKAPEFTKPTSGPPKFFDGRPHFIHVFLFELAHMYLLFFISTFTSIAVRTHQYMAQIEQKQTVAAATIADQKAAMAEKETMTKKSPEAALTVTVNYSLVRMEFSEILFIKSMDNYLQFYLKNKKPLLVRMTLKEAAEKLPTDAFVRVHKSYIVAVAAVESIRNKTILIAQQEIPIGRAYETAAAVFFEK